jgi:tetratricopeptide (TPR) repeat protein
VCEVSGLSVLEPIQKRLRGLASKRPSFVVAVHGEAGIGKTFAVSHLLRDAPCATGSVHATAPLGVLLGSLPKPRRLPVWAASALERFEFVDETTLTDAVSAALSSAAPFALHVEDIHEAGPERLEWLLKLAEAVKGTRGVALIVTSRVPPPSSFEAVHLEPMGLQETRALLEGQIGAPLPTPALEWITTRAAGNRLFTLEFFRSLARQGFAWNDAHRWHWRTPPTDAIPVTVEALIETVLSNAADSADLETVLGAASMLPADSSLERLASVAAMPVSEVAVGEAALTARGVLAPNRDFVHPLYREVARGRLTQEQTRSFARRALVWLGDDTPERSLEFIEPAQLEPHEALERYDAIIGKWRTLGRPVDAARLLHRSLALRHGADRSRAALEALEVLHDVDFNLSAELLETAMRAENLETSKLETLCELLARHERETDAWRLLERVGALPPMLELEWRVRLWSLAGKSQAVLELVDAHPTLLNSRQPVVVQRLVHVLATAGRGAQAAETGLRALESDMSLVERVGLLQTTATASFYAGRFQDAANLWTQSIDLALEGGLDIAAMKTTINRAQVLIRLGDKARAETDLEEASKLARQFGEQRIYAQSLVMLGVTLTERSAFERAEETLLEASSMLSEGRFADLQLNAEFALSELYRVWASPHAPFLMQKYARQALRHARAFNNLIFTLNAQLLSSTAELQTGNAARALELADEALEQARQHQRHFQTMSAQRCRAAALERLGDTSTALETWRESVRLARALNLPLHEQENQLEVDHLTGDADGARERLAWFEANDHPLEASKARRYFPILDAEQTTATPTASLARLEVLGRMRLNGETVRGRKRQELLAALLETRVSGRVEASKLELLDALYPDSDEEQGANALKETVRLVRQSLGSGVIQTTTNGYALGNVRSDAESFLATLDTNLWRGTYLEGLTPTNETIRETLHSALHASATRRLETEPKEAARIGRLLLEYDPYHLEHLHLTLQALRSSDNHKSLNRVYLEARARMAEVGEELPERWQDFLERR